MGLALLSPSDVAAQSDSFTAYNDMVPTMVINDMLTHSWVSNPNPNCVWNRYTHGRNWDAESQGGHLAVSPQVLLDTEGFMTQTRVQFRETTTHEKTINNAKDPITIKRGSPAWEEFAECMCASVSCDEDTDECTCEPLDGNLSYNDAPGWVFDYVFSGLNPSCEVEVVFFVNRGEKNHDKSDYASRYSLFTLKNVSKFKAHDEAALLALDAGHTLAIRSGANNVGHIAKWTIAPGHLGHFQVSVTHDQKAQLLGKVSPSPHDFKAYSGGVFKIRQICTPAADAASPDDGSNDASLHTVRTSLPAASTTSAATAVTLTVDRSHPKDDVLHPTAGIALPAASPMSMTSTTTTIATEDRFHPNDDRSHPVSIANAPMASSLRATTTTIASSSLSTAVEFRARPGVISSENGNQQKGTLLLRARLRQGEDINSVQVRIQTHKTSLETVLADTLGYKSVGILDITVSGRRLLDQTVVSLKIHFVAQDKASKKNEYNFIKQVFQSLFDGNRVEVLNVDVEWIRVPTPSSAPDETQKVSIPLCIGLACAALFCCGITACILSKCISSQRLGKKTKAAKIESQCAQVDDGIAKPKEIDTLDNVSVSTGTPSSDGVGSEDIHFAHIVSMDDSTSDSLSTASPGERDNNTTSVIQI
jgi:hypothetical protein